MSARTENNKKIKAESKKKQKRRNHCAESRKKPRERPHFAQWNVNLRFYYNCFQNFFSIFGFSLLLQLISMALNSHFHKLSKFVNVFAFIKGYIIRSVVVAIQKNFPSMFHKNNFLHCEVTRKQYKFCPQHLILSWGTFRSQQI